MADAVAAGGILSELWGGLAFVVLLGSFVAAGWRPACAIGPTSAPGYRVTLAVLFGCVAFTTLLAWLDLVGVPWSGPVLLGVLLILVLAGRWWPAPSEETPHSRLPREGSGLGWGDRLALLIVLVSLVIAWQLWAVNPDFIYHWGLKGKRYALSGGIDHRFLTKPWSGYAHPEYPQLLPTLFAAQARLSGAFSERWMMLWTALPWLALLTASRQVAHHSTLPRVARQVGVLLVVAASATFAVGYGVIGGPDLMIACVPVVAWSLWLRPAGPANDLALGFTAAFAAAAKIEGIVLAGGILAVCLFGRNAASPLSRRLAALARTASPVAVAVAPWAIDGLRYGLFAEGYGAGFDPARIPVIAEALVESVSVHAWHGLSFVLVALPLLCWPRRTRHIAALVGLQLAFYLYIYLRADYANLEQVGFLVKSSFPRLALHLVPTLWLAVVVALEAEKDANEVTE